jgi:glyoxalase family protein
MRQTIPGIHHVTAIAGDPQRNFDFYTGILGLRMVKRTVNFDDPATYHLYYADQTGSPGSIMTFFPWPSAPRGRAGSGQVVVTSFSIPAGSAGHWRERLGSLGVPCDGPSERFQEEVLTVTDPDGLELELVAHADPPSHADPALQGFHSVTLSVEGYEQTAKLLTEVLGFGQVGEEGNRFRYQATGSGPASRVDVLCQPGMRPGSMGTGTVHHVAWRATDDAQQVVWRQELIRQGFNVTPVMDRNYFKSIYFREPGGVLFEIATDPPGFAIDEAPEALGGSLKLPPWLEKRRDFIEQRLPPLRLG